MVWKSLVIQVNKSMDDTIDVQSYKRIRSHVKQVNESTSETIESCIYTFEEVMSLGQVWSLKESCQTSQQNNKSTNKSTNEWMVQSGHIYIHIWVMYIYIHVYIHDACKYTFMCIYMTHVYTIMHKYMTHVRAHRPSSKATRLFLTK